MTVLFVPSSLDSPKKYALPSHTPALNIESKRHSRAKREYLRRFEHLKRLPGLLHESQGQNLARNVLCVPCFLDNGQGTHLLRRKVKRFQRDLVFKAHRRLHHSTLGSRVIKNYQYHQPNNKGRRFSTSIINRMPTFDGSQAAFHAPRSPSPVLGFGCWVWGCRV